MKAVVDEDVRTVGVHDVADATIEAASDAVVRVTSSAICGTDRGAASPTATAVRQMVDALDTLDAISQAVRRADQPPQQPLLTEVTARPIADAIRTVQRLFWRPRDATPQPRTP
jgi:hypothetical protein